jgi:hypothetical protein
MSANRSFFKNKIKPREYSTELSEWEKIAAERGKDDAPCRLANSY